MRVETVVRYKLFCLRCNKSFTSATRNPKACAKCRNAYWQTPRRIKKSA